MSKSLKSLNKSCLRVLWGQLKDYLRWKIKCEVNSSSNILDLEQECLDKGGLLICAGNLFTVKSTQWPRDYSWDTVYFSSNSIFCNFPLSACTLREQSVQKHEGESVKEFLLYLLLTGPNSGAGTRHWSARVHCRVHGHAQLWQVPWAWGVIMLLPVLLWLVRRRMTTRRRKWMHRRSSVCMWGFFSLCSLKHDISTPVKPGCICTWFSQQGQ